MSVSHWTHLIFKIPQNLISCKYYPKFLFKFSTQNKRARQKSQMSSIRLESSVCSTRVCVCECQGIPPPSMIGWFGIAIGSPVNWRFMFKHFVSISSTPDSFAVVKHKQTYKSSQEWEKRINYSSDQSVHSFIDDGIVCHTPIFRLGVPLFKLKQGGKAKR